MVKRRRKRAPQPAVRASQRKKVGEFIRQRRRQLGLSQRDIVEALGYKSAVSISDVEIGRTRVPFRRMYQYADVLRLPRDEFVRFVVGELQGRPRAATRPPRIVDGRQRKLNAVEQEVIENFRRLPSQHRNSLRKQIREYLVPRGKRAAGRRRSASKARRGRAARRGR